MNSIGSGNSDLLDDSPFTFRKLSEGQSCEIELTGPADPQTGIQFTRTILLDADSPRIQFHASMKNITGHTLEWSMQSVSQYNTAIPGPQGAEHAAQMNHDFWTFTPANPSSSYLNRYHVRFGPAENPAVSVRDDNLFTVHYVHMAAELWLDSTEGWLAVVDGNTQYAMVERFQYDVSKPYPGKASVIFWTNGPEIRVKSDGNPSLSADPDASPYYLEAEINSPMCHLRPNESCSFETEWFPTRSGSEFHGVTDAGIVIRPLLATGLDNGKIKLSGSFGVFYSGRLIARFYDEHGGSLGTATVAEVDPGKAVSLDTEISSPAKTARLSIHLLDESGTDRGALQEVHVSAKTITNMKRNSAAITLFLLATFTQRLLSQEPQTAGPAALHVKAEDLLITPVGENWPSYNGDYSGRRFSSLREINKANVGQFARPGFSTQAILKGWKLLRW